MKLYFLPDEHRYVHRLLDVPNGMTYEPRDIPTDLAGLMAHLNALHAEIAVLQDMAEKPVIEPVIETPPALVKQPDIAPDLNVEEAIQNANPVQLASYASNVCWRIKELANA